MRRTPTPPRPGGAFWQRAGLPSRVGRKWRTAPDRPRSPADIAANRRPPNRPLQQTAAATLAPQCSLPHRAAAAAERCVRSSLPHSQRFPFRLGHELQHNVLARPEGETDPVAVALRVRELCLRRQSDEETLSEDGMGQEVPLAPPGAIGCPRVVRVGWAVNYIELPQHGGPA